MPITSRQDLKDYCLEKCGKPVVDVNVADIQVDHAIDDAVDFFQEYHYNGTEHQILAHKLTQTEMDQEYITLPTEVVSVRTILGWGSQTDLPGILFDVDYHLHFAEVFNAASAGFLADYHLNRMYFSQINDTLDGDSRFRFNEVTHTLYIDAKWGSDFKVDDYIVMETYEKVDPDTHPALYNEWILRELAAANVKYQWGMNLSKFSNIELPGGVTMNGEQIIQKAEREIETIKQNFIMRFQEPDGFFIA